MPPTSNEDQYQQAVQAVDSIEKVQIHLFDRPVLLDSQPRRSYRPYVPFEEDMQRILQLDLRRAISYLSRRPQQGTPGAVRNPLQRINQEVATTHIINLRQTIAGIYRQLHGQMGTSHSRTACWLIPRFLEFLARQAAPFASAFINGYAPLTLFGKDMTQQDASMRRGYFEGSRAGALAQSMISAIIQSPVNTAALSFLDLWITVVPQSAEHLHV